ncbi:hypothetical protein POM88_026973 [Heracleum sosnowskyi]|uniref:Helitron helicase-like domain-containing protein n=1 Tax=Heracleum sosnowskyi TaxID=360622 RepID=A0AAD8I6V5_9APIA|nr:hypothetical protein POM88_026973 [Heracleum sosnowskyi]
MCLLTADPAIASSSASAGPTTTESVPLSSGATAIGSSAMETSTSSGAVIGSPQTPPGGALGLFICLSGSFRANLLISSFPICLAAANNIILDIGDPDQHCGCCAAHVWQAEYTGRPSGPGPKGYSICCGKGKVQLPLLQETPVELAALLGGTTSRAKKFQKNIRVYNIIFALCSFGGSVDESINNGSGPFVFRENDLTYHSIGSLLPPDGHTPKFAQFYMYDGQEAIEHRVNFPRGNSVLDPAIVATLQEMLSRDNALVGIFKQLRERYPPSEQIPVRLRLLERRSTDGRFIQRAVVAAGYQDASVRPDLIARVFKIKLDAMMSDLTKENVLGRVLAVVYTIEFQKHGLPHAHIVLWLAEGDKLMKMDMLCTAGETRGGQLSATRSTLTLGMLYLTIADYL